MHVSLPAISSALLLALSLPAIAGDVTIVHPGDLKSAPIPAAIARDAEAAYVSSDPTRPALYTLRVHLRAGGSLVPHTHPDDRVVVILSGDLLVGSGTIADEAHGTLVHAGDTLLIPAGTVHWSLAANGDVDYQENGIGPTATTPTAP